MFKVNNGHPRRRCKVCSKLTSDQNVIYKYEYGKAVNAKHERVTTAIHEAIAIKAKYSNANQDL